MSLIICPECKKKISEFASSCPGCGCPMSVIEDIILRKMLEDDEIHKCEREKEEQKRRSLEQKQREQTKSINNISKKANEGIYTYQEDAHNERLDRQIEALEQNAKKAGVYMDWSKQPPEIQYRNYCKKIEERNKKNHEAKPVKVFSFQTGYVSDVKDLIRYTKEGLIKWNYCQSASWYNANKDEFCIVFVSSTYCILEIRGSGKKANRVYFGYLKLGKDKEFQPFEEWRSIYTKINNTNKEWDTKIIIKTLKEKSLTYIETNWDKIVLVSAEDAKKTEKHFNYVFSDEVPMSYRRFLKEVVYPECWGPCGMSGGSFSPR